MARKRRGAGKGKSGKKAGASGGATSNVWRRMTDKDMEDLRKRLGDDAFEAMIRRIEKAQEQKALHRDRLYEDYIRALVQVAIKEATERRATRKDPSDTCGS